MLIKTFRVIFGFFGFITGLTIAHTGLSGIIPDVTFYKYPIYILLGLIIALLMYYISGKTFIIINKLMGKAEHTAANISFYEVLIGCIGLIVGLIVANLIAIPFRNINVIGGPMAVILNIILGAGGIYFAISKKDEISLDNFKGKKRAGGKILDTCVIIDGRITDIVQTGFIDGPLVVPHFIMKELQNLADNSDSLKRSRGKRGLEMLENMKNTCKNLHIVETELDSINIETDVKLIKYANKTGGSIITNDYNLNKVAAVTGIKVLNLNDLANSVKRITLPGEEMTINVLKRGKENGQGIGYLEDGTMVIIEKGNEYIGMDMNVVVTSVMQTSAGRLVFTKIK